MNMEQPVAGVSSNPNFLKMIDRIWSTTYWFRKKIDRISDVDF